MIFCSSLIKLPVSKLSPGILLITFQLILSLILYVNPYDCGIIRYKIPTERRKQFEGAYEKASGLLNKSPHCSRYELSHCAEEQDFYTLRIEWDSLDGHMKGFRAIPEFMEFFELVKPFFNDIQEMHHYEVIQARGNDSLGHR